MRSDTTKSALGVRHVCALTFALVGTLGLFWFLGGVTRAGRDPNAGRGLSTAAIAFVDLHRAATVEASGKWRPRPVARAQPTLPARLTGIVDHIRELNLLEPPTMPNVNLSHSSAGAPFTGRADRLAPPAADTFLALDLIPLDRAQPPYPVDAADASIAGFVRIEFVVQVDGRVRDAIVVEADPKGSFEAAAVAAVLTWRFKPRIINGEPVEWRASQKITFTPASRRH